MNDVLLVIVGALIGFLASVGVLVVERVFDRAGYLKIYFKFINSKPDERPWGVYEQNELLVLLVPVVYELQNTTNTPLVVRDLSIDLYKGSHYICSMVQICKSESSCVTSSNSGMTYGDNGSYSFVVAPRSIMKRECLYSYYISKDKAADMTFDSLVISYSDEKDKRISYTAKTNLLGWKITRNHADYEWTLLK